MLKKIKKLKKVLTDSELCVIICFVADEAITNALLAQLVEHLTLNQGVQGSSPWRRTREPFPETGMALFV